MGFLSNFLRKSICNQADIMNIMNTSKSNLTTNDPNLVRYPLSITRLAVNYVQGSNMLVGITIERGNISLTLTPPINDLFVDSDLIYENTARIYCRAHPIICSANFHTYALLLFCANSIVK